MVRPAEVVRVEDQGCQACAARLQAGRHRRPVPSGSTDGIKAVALQVQASRHRRNAVARCLCGGRSGCSKRSARSIKVVGRQRHQLRASPTRRAPVPCHCRPAANARKRRRWTRTGCRHRRCAAAVHGWATSSVNRQGPAASVARATDRVDHLAQAEVDAGVGQCPRA